jgi:hypothetical protein
VSRELDQDKALARLLQSLTEEPEAPTPACLDAERLAAWSEGGLPAVEREAIDAHLATCGRCLAMLQVLAQTAEVGETATGVREAGGRVSRWPLRWLVPMTTAAAAVLLWMVLPGRPELTTPVSQVAREESSTPRLERFDDARAADQQSSTSSLEAEPPARSAPPAASPVPPASPTPPAPIQERARQSIDSIGEVGVQPPLAKGQAGGGAPQAPAASQTNEALADSAAGAPSPRTTVAAAPALARAEASAIEIHSPDPARRWRIRGQLIERSTNGGLSWQQASIPASVVVIAGASPDPDVCWLVGTNGTVLRTTDGVRFEAADVTGAGTLVSVQAIDAQRARVTAADKQTYATVDGGRSWSR